ncbi:ABC transporter permease subunit, partial [Streptacidiphilus monticola]
MSAPLTVELAFAGIAVGSAAALSGIGLVVCYRATGVLNLAQGAIAMVTAYALRQCVVVWHWPRPLALCACLLVFAPGLGWALDALVFRRLQRRGAGTVHLLVACLGVFVLLVGAAYLLWGPVPRLDAPKVLPFSALWVVLVLAAGVAAVSRFTGFGRQVRAVVDNRGLAELAGVDADRVSSVGWAFSAFTAGLTGALLAPELRLDPFGLPLLVMETVAVAVLAGLRSLTLAVVSALLLGVVQSELTQLQSPTWHAVSANVFVLALLAGGLWLLPRGSETRPVPPGPPIPADDADRFFPVRVAVMALLLIPFAFRPDDLRAALQVPALALVLLSVVVVTGYGGQISLGQAGYAGVGALLTGALAASMPPLLALACAVLIAAPLGLLVGWPAIRRRGLALALTTFAVGTAFSRLVFEQPDLTGGLVLDRGTGGPLADDRFFYGLELALLLCALTVVRLLRRGPTGRALGAMRDHEPGAAAAGVAVPRLKLGAFVLGAALAALGGGLLALGGQAFDASAFDPVQGLVWFAAVIVLGPDSAVGALLAAALLTALPTGPAIALLGLLALLPLPPGGLAAFPRQWLTPTHA